MSMMMGVSPLISRPGGSFMTEDLPITSSPVAPAEPSKKRGSRRVIILAVVLIAAITGVYCSPIRSWLANADRVRQVVASLGLWIYPLGIVAGGLMVGCGIPRLVLCLVAGTVLGFWGGLLIGVLGTILGYYCVFMFIRWGGREWALHRWPKLNKWAELVKGQGIVGVILLRQMPIHGTITNLGLGLSGMRQRDFVIGTAIGIIPESIPVILVGTGLMKGSPKEIVSRIAIAAICFAVIWILCAYVMKRMRKSRSGTTLMADPSTLTDLGD
jgi:uncharacterized membrane protein YdjX (TVP38/TMEM64 family)